MKLEAISVHLQSAFVHFEHILTCTVSFTHLHQVDDVQEELVGILLSVGGKLWVSPADQGLQHAWRDALLLVLEREHLDVTHTECA